MKKRLPALDILLFVRFENGTVEIEGVLWPCELKALWEIVGIYKQENKENNKK